MITQQTTAATIFAWWLIFPTTHLRSQQQGVATLNLQSRRGIMGWTPRFMMYQKLLKSNYAVWAANYAVSPANYAVSFFTFFRFVFLKPWTNSKHIQLYSVRSLPPFLHTNLNGGNKMLPFLRNPKVFGIFDITHHFLKHCFRASAPRCRRHKRWQRSAGVNLRSQGNRKAWLTSKHFWGSYALVNEVTTDSSVTICCLVETNKTKKWVHP